MFSSPTTPETSRPRLKPSKSTGWSWPRLVTVKEAPLASAARAGTESAPHEEEVPMATSEKPPPLSPIQDSEMAGFPESSSPIPPIEKLEVPHSEEAVIADADQQSSMDGEPAGPATTAELEHKIEKAERNGEPVKTVRPPVIPIIKIQRASKSSDHSDYSPREAPMPPTIDSVLAKNQQQVSDQTENQQVNLLAVIPQPTEALLETAVAPVKIRKRKIVLRKTRNVVARKTLLKMGLGRQLAMPTKEALRRLAKGEDVTVADISVVS
ncbi:MAG: hypothetical protein Q9163_000574 [Psora crenata]